MTHDSHESRHNGIFLPVPKQKGAGNPSLRLCMPTWCWWMGGCPCVAYLYDTYLGIVMAFLEGKRGGTGKPLHKLRILLFSVILAMFVQSAAGWAPIQMVRLGLRSQVGCWKTREKLRKRAGMLSLKRLVFMPVMSTRTLTAEEAEDIVSAQDKPKFGSSLEVRSQNACRGAVSSCMRWIERPPSLSCKHGTGLLQGDFFLLAGVS